MVITEVNVGRSAVIGERRGRPWRSAIEKAPTGDGRVAVGVLGLDGDEQHDRRFHGGPHQAVYAYAQEDAAFWTEELGRTVDSTVLGQNLTTAGADVSNARIGERWRVGTTPLEVTGPRIPCATLARRADDPGFVKRFTAAGRPGAYLRVLEPGALGVGDPVLVEERPEALSVATVMEILLFAHDRAGELLELGALNPVGLAWARGRAPR